MSDALIAINEELRRLEQEGVDHVFVEESTLSLLKPALQEESSKKQTSTNGAISDLKELANKKDSKAGKVEKTTSRPTHKIKPLPKQPASFDLPAGNPSEQMAWLEKQVNDCPTCKEHLSEHGKVVFGTGNVKADIFFCGEAPGADEEIAGEPFVGKAGQLLTKIIQAMGLQREEVYIANILKWRPEHDKPSGNRPPTVEEMNFCMPYLKSQINIVQPKVIVALGNAAVTGLLGADPNRRLGSVRGTWQAFEGIPLMITFHPAYLLRSESTSNPNAKKRLVWEDMLKVMERVGLSINEKQRGFFLPKTS